MPEWLFRWLAERAAAMAGVAVEGDVWKTMAKKSTRIEGGGLEMDAETALADFSRIAEEAPQGGPGIRCRNACRWHGRHAAAGVAALGGGGGVLYASLSMAMLP